MALTRGEIALDEFSHQPAKLLAALQPTTSIGPA